MDAQTGITPELVQNIKSILTPEVEEPQAPVEPESQPPENTEPEAEAQPEVQTIKVIVDGEEVEIPLEEAKKGYSRTADYTRKTQKLAEERKALEAEASAVRAEREEYKNTLDLLKSQLQQVQEPDWARLQNEDPIEYLKQKDLNRDRKEKLALVEQEQRRVAELQSQEQQKAFQRYLEDEQSKLLNAFPEWRDAKTAKADKERIANFALSLGYTESDVAQIYDHRAVVALRKAALYDEMMSKAKAQTERVKDGPKTAKPGNLQTQPAGKEFLDAKARLQKSGSLHDFAAAFKALEKRTT